MSSAKLSRRTLLKSAAGLAAVPFVFGAASTPAAAKELFTLPKLPWPEDALAPLMFGVTANLLRSRGVATVAGKDNA